ncbi:hypothetical protein VNO77_42541 [Canavalia gladiata]|uniref:Uncharacterized protein n=1 Tax=Canavalia gladiata TaxID=3824 RepID=A0AAN9PNI8_CANGL
MELSSPFCEMMVGQLAFQVNPIKMSFDLIRNFEIDHASVAVERALVFVIHLAYILPHQSVISDWEAPKSNSSTMKPCTKV